MQEKKAYILWLPSWYPNREDAFDGDFIQRHAQAAARETNIYVLFVKPIAQHEKSNAIVQQSNGLTEHIIYIKKEHGILKKFVRQVAWFQTYAAAIRKLIQERGLPQLVHVHVPWRAGVVALWMKRTFGVPYLVTEHWGIYNNVVADRFSKQPWWLRQLIRRVYRQAKALAMVSHFIGDAINRYGVLKKCTVIPNVVDTSLFTFHESLTTPFTFIHVSNMVPLKNVAGILDAFALFQQKNADAQLILVGNRDATYVKYAERLKLHRVYFKGEIPYAEVARHMQAAHCLLVNSLMENAPCVIGEALCCGLPVIATNVGGIPELVDARNGILIPPNDTTALATAMREVYGDLKKFDRRGMAEAAAARFGVPVIARKFAALYHAVASHAGETNRP